MACGTYDRRQKALQNDLRDLSQQVKKEAMAKEKQIAVEKGEVDVNATPLISVFADGSYPKRSYRTHYEEFLIAQKTFQSSIQMAQNYVQLMTLKSNING